MSGGMLTLWRTSLCGVVVALTVFSTGCAVDASSDAEDETEEAQAGLIVVGSTDSPGSEQLTAPGSGSQLPTTGSQTQSPAAKVDELIEPEPEPWHPRSLVDSEDSALVTLGTRADRSGDRK